VERRGSWTATVTAETVKAETEASHYPIAALVFGIGLSSLLGVKSW
jgi:hypothetical protein